MIIKKFQGRLNVLTIIVVLIFVVLIGRLGYLQIAQGEYYERLANGNRIRLIPIMAPRGTIYDKNGVALVFTKPGFTASLLPVNGPISAEVISKTAKILNVTPESIEKKLEQNKGSFTPVRIKTDIGPEAVAMIEERRNELPGVVIEIQPIRNYVYNEMAAHILGYVNEISDSELVRLKDAGYKSGDLIGKFGLEKKYDKLLRGVDGGGQVEVDVNGRPVQVLGKKDPVAGNSLILTIDSRIQNVAEQAISEQLKYLQTTMRNPKAQAAAVIVINPKNGEIIAMASNPTFNPNLFTGGISTKEWTKINENPYHPMGNKAISGEYPPGSTFKVITAMAAVELGKVSPTEKIFDAGSHRLVPDKRNAGGVALGWINFRQGLSMSNNVYFYEMGNRLGIDNIEKYARMFGLGNVAGIDIDEEAEGLVASKRYKEEIYKEDWYISETFDAAIGQGFNLVTPLQMAMVISQIANGGTFYRPHLVSKITGVNSETIKEFTPEPVRTLPVSPANIKLIRDSLRDAATVPGGTSAAHFSDFPIAVAGKTGTAENPHGVDHSWFMAFAPYDDPQVAIVVLVEQGGYGSVAAAPIAKRIFEAIFITPAPSAPQKP